MNDRQRQILSILIDDYVEENKPISSGFLVSRHHLEFSPATVRNELAELLENGYLKKIYFSSGNVPTNKAYRLKVEEVLVSEPQDSRQSQSENFSSLEGAVSFLAKRFGALTCGVDEDLNLFIDGIDELFGQPDFNTRDQYLILGRLVECLQEMKKQISHQSENSIFVGRENPFWDESDDLSWLVGSSKNNYVNIVSIGPTRMPYKKNWQIFKEVLENF
ncbi:MAG: hypothetical protein A2418_02660 [Candidatus Brennerbacteria bacterium RIFOXYC1_FULL_41_11]|uniref:Heat-inducible transcription repressor HrcA C-terminal domain-containing protein n=1 Tax=Candidatus Brennerbacteria bacterium RIFOXYD1_FULL_41_16 TaxID=1797529 RepID=A0A1G1XK14_9BACT|nr:MAG: Heat-inducible transcription repressor hrcA [Parcubacteria group bacterium GW2011_GWB1_41_4]OGY38798.1 MAG: hypothetical protein A2391_02415 [Candidatus Brennerbacteria bacterium RIFOXYB1_FULL_41_13]OGY39081.1 MAG: hypothetical protein A2418_02660 [Candidatus Brennerbacteria bacterium RIFOXYC1_FULL_41_11]OGY40234.1 MAG: hypothetical protein A2570_03040 [Candidatus Brennerbacteria bacterium RIFOXYD1_FULL_41_16]